MLVAIEGIDGSGKGTQAGRLSESLQAEGLSCQLISFPRYEKTFFGRAVGDFLNGRFGTLEQVDPHLAALLYAGDRWESRDELLTATEKFDVVILDRYVASNVAHQGAKKNGEDRRRIVEWILQLEHEVYRLPRADLTFLLDIPVNVAVDLIARKSARSYTDRDADLQEADHAYLAAVRELYRNLAVTDSGWCRISVVDQQNQLRTIEDIQSEICETVLQHR
ncbi:MAG: dTMP kinase [Planctomycetaceae bacterium]